MSYRHTQPGTLILIACLLAGGFGAALAWRGGQRPMSVALIVMMIGTAVLFPSLTVEVGEGELR
jgi:hypothetical protein